MADLNVHWTLPNKPCSTCGYCPSCGKGGDSFNQHFTLDEVDVLQAEIKLKEYEQKLSEYNNTYEEFKRIVRSKRELVDGEN